MLSAHQCEIIAYMTDCEILCRTCAAKVAGSDVALARFDAGMSIGLGEEDLRPLSRYEVDEIEQPELYRAELRDKDSSADVWEGRGDTAADAVADALSQCYSGPYDNGPGYGSTHTFELELENEPVHESCHACGEELS